MKKRALASFGLTIASTIALVGGAASQNQVSALGLKDGVYCKVGGSGAIGDNVHVSAKDSPPYIGIDGLDCHDPIMSNGRLIAKSCYANGGIKLDVSKTFSATGDRITVDGDDFVLTPTIPGKAVCDGTAAAVVPAQSKSRMSNFGVQQGTYCSKEGLQIGIGPSNAYLSMVDCKNPVISNGMLRAKACETTGGFKVDFEATFRASGDTIKSDGKDYVLTPERPGKLPCEATVSHAVTEVSEEPEPFIGAGHNGSDMELTDTQIIYTRPKASIRDVVKPGTVLVDGKWNGERFQGTAYAFKKGCAAAPYAVSGEKVTKPGRMDLVLRGAGPIRKGCDVIGYSWKSPHSRLVFDQIMSN